MHKPEKVYASFVLYTTYNTICQVARRDDTGG